MSTYYTPVYRRGPNGKAPKKCVDIDHRFRTITGHTFCVRCNLPYRSFISGQWPDGPQ